VSATSHILLQDAVAALRQRIDSATELSPSDGAFLFWTSQDDASRAKLRGLAESASASFSTSRSYHDLAVLGYAARMSAVEADGIGVLRAGLTWLCGRNANIDGEPAAFVTDAVALLGIAFGAKAVSDETGAEVLLWLQSFVPGAASLPAMEAWQKCLFSAGLAVFGATDVALPTDGGVADMRTALRALSIISDGSSTEDSAEDERLTLELLTRQATSDLPIAQAALRLTAFAWVQRTAPVAISGRATVADLVELLRRFPAGLRRWPWETKARVQGGEARKWHIDHEYHVQDLLYFLLVPIFPDLKDEEYFTSLGQKQPRTDLYLPSLKLIVEVKFLRQRDRITKILDEVASDAGLYLPVGSNYAGIVAFIWDDSRRTEEHALLRDGLQKIRGVVGAVIVPRPGMMT
jgi:hypothetical protein